MVLILAYVFLIMWIAIFKVMHEGSVATELTAKFDVKAYGFYVGNFKQGNELYSSKVLLVTGPDAPKYIASFHLDKRVKEYGVEGNQIFYFTKAMTPFHTQLADKSVYFVKPALFTQGAEFWTVASFSKKSLMNFYNRLRSTKKCQIELMSISTGHADLFANYSMPTLTERQKQAFNLAIGNNYYNYPRQISLTKLAQLSGLSYSAFKENLRKAEQKILNEHRL